MLRLLTIRLLVNGPSPPPSIQLPQQNLEETVPAGDGIGASQKPPGQQCPPISNKEKTHLG